MNEVERLISEAVNGGKAAPLTMIGFNDSQLVMILAAIVSGEARDEAHAVAYAIGLVAETMVQMSPSALSRAIDAAKARIAVGG